jgi:3-hydroxybutyryl-CoA dehydrogenase
MSRAAEIERVAVIGAGTLGAQIAMLAVNAGYQVRVFDIKPDAFEETIQQLGLDYRNKKIQPFIPFEEWEACQQAIRQDRDLDTAIENAELIMEVVSENLNLKRQVFQELGRKAAPEVILATNSSSIPISHIEQSSGRPQHCLNIHFYMPLQGMNMADVMGGTQTLPEVMENGIRWVRSLGCVPLTVKKELLGFCFNRVWRAVKREVLHMWANDFVDFRDVDRAWMIFTGRRDGPGPFGLMDVVGLDVVYDIEMVYYRDSNNPEDHPPEALKQKIERGELGVKTGKGFYTYPGPEYLHPDFLGVRSIDQSNSS